MDIRTFLVDAGWRPWAFVKVQTDEGIVGYGECTCELTQYGVLGVVEDMKPVLVGADPLAFEMRFWDMYRRTRLGSTGGVASKAIGGIEAALLDIKGKSLGISVAELFGGPLRETVPLYWSHFCISRAIAPEMLGVKPVRSMADVVEAAHEVVERGYKALKTNIFTPGDPPVINYQGFGGGPGTTDQVVSRETLRQAVLLFETIRNTVGPDLDIILDLNFNYKPESIKRIAHALEDADLSWLEFDILDIDSVLEVKKGVNVPVSSGEVLYYIDQYRPYFERRAMDIVMLDTAWNGFAQAKKIGDLAQAFQVNVCPHNYYSHLSTFMSANLCAVLPNVQMMEFDVDDVPWRDDLVTVPPEIIDGEMVVPTGPGWGTELNEDEALRRSWDYRVPRISIPTGIEEERADDEEDDQEPRRISFTAFDSLIGPWKDEASSDVVDSGGRSDDSSVLTSAPASVPGSPAHRPSSPPSRPSSPPSRPSSPPSPPSSSPSRPSSPPSRPSSPPPPPSSSPSRPSSPPSRPPTDWGASDDDTKTGPGDDILDE